VSKSSYLRSFAGGEIAPELFGRLDLVKNQTGLQRAENFIIRAEGPASNRAGFEWVIETKDSSKRSVGIPFIFNAAQAYVLEFGDQYMRIHTEGGTVLSAAQNITAISQANPGVLTYSGADPANGTWVFLSGIGGMTQLNGRYVKVANVNAGANTFEITDTGGANINTTGYTAYTAGGTMSPVYEIATPYLEADLFDLHYTQSQDVLTITHPTYQQRQLVRSGATSWALSTFTLAPTQPAPTGVTVTPSAAGGETYAYIVTAVNSDGLEESLSSTAGTNGACQVLSAGGAYNTVTWTNASGAVRYNVYRRISGVFGYVGQGTDGAAGFKDDNIQPDLTQSPPEGTDPFVGAGNYPGAVGYYQGRRWFAGTTNKQQNLWGTRSGTESNLTYSIPTQADDAVQARLTARQANTIRHIVPLKDLLLLTSGAEWVVDTGGAAGVLDPTNLSYRPEGYIGANNVQPVVTGKAVLYCESNGGRVREIKYKWESQGYDPEDVSVMAPHLFDGYTITSMTYAHVPFRLLFATRSDGTLLAMTYVPEHQVAAWHQHTTNGEFEHVCAIPENGENMLYAVVAREINGRTVRSIERMRSRQIASLSDAFFVDAGVTITSPASLTISNSLWHLEGEEVAILVDGAVHPVRTVTNGAITLELDELPDVVHVGLAYNADLETLPIAVEAEAFGQGMQKNVNGVRVRVNASSGLFAGPAFDKLREDKQRTTETFGVPPERVTGMRNIMLVPSWNSDGTVCIRQSNPLPLTVVALAPNVAYGG